MVTGRPEGSAFLIVGEVRKPHGVKGALYVAPATDDIENVYAAGRSLAVGDGAGRIDEPPQTLTVSAARSFKGGLIVEFSGVEDRTVAGFLRGKTLLMPREEASPLEPDEYFLHDLIGLEVREEEHGLIGRVSEVYPVGRGYLLGVSDGGKERLIPFSRQLVREVDVEKGTLTIAAPEGLLDI